jgi:hypothetical protein
VDCLRETGATNDEEDLSEDEPNPGCPFCRKDIATDSDLLDFALGELELTRDQLLERYRAASPDISAEPEEQP